MTGLLYDMQKHVGILLLRPLRSIAIGVRIGQDMKRVQPDDAIDVAADVFRKDRIDLVHVLPVEQRPHLANGLVADPRHDTTDIVKHRLDRGAFGTPGAARAWQLEDDRTNLARLAGSSSARLQTGNRAACHRCALAH
jgi:hypothetical protein